MIQTVIITSILVASIATVETPQVLSIDVDGDGAPEEVNAQSATGGTTLNLS